MARRASEMVVAGGRARVRLEPVGTGNFRPRYTLADAATGRSLGELERWSSDGAWHWYPPASRPGDTTWRTGHRSRDGALRAALARGPVTAAPQVTEATGS